VIIAEMAAAHVPMVVFRFDVQREIVRNQQVEAIAKLGAASFVSSLQALLLPSLSQMRQS